MSYLEYYGLKEQPFSISVDNRFYFESQQHVDALVRLRHAIEFRKGLALLVGDVGAGKSMLAQRLLDGLDETRFESALLIVIHSSITAQWLLRKIAVQMGIDNPSKENTELLRQVYNRLIDINDQGKIAVVLIDEAQMLQSRELMEEIRGLLNMEVDGKKLINFILFGLREVDSYLALDEPLRQRVAMRYRLQGFTQETTVSYIKYRMKFAGAPKEVFTPEAYDMVHKYSKGYPRLINILCDNTLLEGFLRKKEAVDQEMIREVASDLTLEIE